MKYEIIKKSFPMKDAEFQYWIQDIQRYLTEDAADLEQFGITTDKLDELNAKIEYFTSFPDDNLMKSYIYENVSEKNSIQKSIFSTIKFMALRVQMKYGANSPQINKMEIKSIESFSDDKILTVSKSIHSDMVAMFADLEEFGLTLAMLNDFDNLNNSYENALRAVKEAQKQRVLKTNERLKLANELYALISIYCKIGKTVYKTADPIRYKRYVIFGTMKSYKLLPPENFIYDETSLKISWNEVKNATSYQLQKSTTGTTFVEIYAGDKLEFTLTSKPGTKTYFKVRARNLKGFGPFSEVLEYKIEI